MKKNYVYKLVELPWHVHTCCKNNVDVIQYHSIPQATKLWKSVSIPTFAIAGISDFCNCLPFALWEFRLRPIILDYNSFTMKNKTFQTSNLHCKKLISRKNGILTFLPKSHFSLGLFSLKDISPKFSPLQKTFLPIRYFSPLFLFHGKHLLN